MIQVKLIQPTQVGQLEYSSDPKTEQHLLFLRSPINANIVFNLNVSGGLIIFGTNEQRVVTSLEINVPRKRWHIVDDLIVPVPIRVANIQLEGFTSKHSEIELPITVYTNIRQSYVHVKLGSNESPVWVSLSERCLASIEDKYLSGFFISLVAGGLV